jgi:Ran GTPase-activating protein (RanGAP) involved in mRNA processing and transport
MKKDKNLSKVILYDYLMDDDAAVLFFSQVFQTEAITLNLMNLSIFHNNLEDTDIELLTQKLDTSFPALKILDLRGNEITDEGAMLIAESLA